jgi:hypothetical protein
MSMVAESATAAILSNTVDDTNLGSRPGRVITASNSTLIDLRLLGALEV